MEPTSSLHSKRLQSYQKQLSRNPALAAALQSALAESEGLTDDGLLYLHVLAPTLVEYTEWVLRSARAAGIQRLYFLARDAYPMYQTAQLLCQSRGWDVDCRYLKVSRYAIRLPEYHLLGEGCVDRICLGGIRVTLFKILTRAGLFLEEMDAVVSEIDFPGGLQRELLYPEVMALRGTLAKCKAFRTAVEAHSRDAFPAALGYLRQEGLLDDVSYALVDSGWVGTLQESLQRLLRTEKPGLKLRGYYFGLYEIPKTMEPDQYACFYFSPGLQIARKTKFSNCLFETVFSAPGGMTLRYREAQGRFLPEESGKENNNAQSLARWDALLLRFAEHYCAESDARPGGAKLCQRLLSRFMGSPEPWEVAAYGGNLFCDDVVDNTLQEVAARLTRKEIRNQRLLQKLLIFAGLKKGEIHESSWIEGSIVRCGGAVKRELFHAHVYKSLIYVRKLWKNMRILLGNNTFSSFGS